MYACMLKPTFHYGTFILSKTCLRPGQDLSETWSETCFKQVSDTIDAIECGLYTAALETTKLIHKHAFD